MTHDMILHQKMLDLTPNHLSLLFYVCSLTIKARIEK
jgi:hypothetical protein